MTSVAKTLAAIKERYPNMRRGDWLALPHMSVRRFFYEAGVEAPVAPSFVDEVINGLDDGYSMTLHNTEKQALSIARYVYPVVIEEHIKCRVWVSTSRPVNPADIQEFINTMDLVVEDHPNAQTQEVEIRVCSLVPQDQ